MLQLIPRVLIIGENYIALYCAKDKKAIALLFPRLAALKMCLGPQGYLILFRTVVFYHEFDSTVQSDFINTISPTAHGNYTFIFFFHGSW